MSGPVSGSVRGADAPAAVRRVFLGLPLPAAARRELAALSESALAAHAAHLRLVDPAGYHATVHFFGPLEADDLRRAQALCGQVVKALSAPLRCALAGLALFPPRGPARVVHAEFGAGHGALTAFLAAARERIAAAGFPVPARAPLPHVTVARVRRGRRRVAEQLDVPAAVPNASAGKRRLCVDFGRLPPRGVASPAPFLLDQLVLFESHLHPAGARYVPLTTRRPASG